MNLRISLVCYPSVSHTFCGSWALPSPFYPQGVRLGRDRQAEHFVLGQQIAVRCLEAEAVQHTSQVEPHGGLGKAAARAAPVAGPKGNESVVGQRGSR